MLGKGQGPPTRQTGTARTSVRRVHSIRRGGGACRAPGNRTRTRDGRWAEVGILPEREA